MAMNSSSWWWRIRATAAALGAVLATAGCVSTQTVRYGEVTALPAAYAPVPAPLSIGDIVAELGAGRAQADLAADIRERGLLAPATAADIDLLLQHGAGDEVTEAVRNESDEMVRPVPPATVVAPAPVTVVPGYGWYPWVPFSFGLWWFDGPSYRRPPPSWRPPPGARPPPAPPAARPLPVPRTSQPVKPSR